MIVFENLVDGDWLFWSSFLPGAIDPVVLPVQFVRWVSSIRVMVRCEDNHTVIVHIRNIAIMNRICYTDNGGTKIMPETPVRYLRVSDDLYEYWRRCAKDVDMNVTQFIIQAVKIGTPFLLTSFGKEERIDKKHTEKG
jgi:hypothetical protein